MNVLLKRILYTAISAVAITTASYVGSYNSIAYHNTEKIDLKQTESQSNNLESKLASKD